MRDIVVVCMTHLSVMAGQAVVVPSNQAHQWTDRCEPIRFSRGCRRRATSHNEVVTWRYTVGRLAASVSGVEALTGWSETAYVGGWTKILYFMTRV